MASQIGIFKIEEANKLRNAQQLAEVLRKQLDPKFEITVGIGGAKKFLSGYTGYKSEDIITIKKSAYHGAIVALMPERKDVTWQAVNVDEIVPNPILDQVVKNSGLLGTLIFNAIFGKGDDLYDKLEDVMQNVLKARKADTSVLNNAKAMFQGKSVLDE